MWDCFLFRDELDLLEARLIELDDAVYRFVLVEATQTFQGQPKPLHYLENAERFAPWEDRIVHVTADLDGWGDHWARERASREAIWYGLDGIGSDDIFVLSDADEIPRPDVLTPDAAGHVLVLRHHAVAVNLLHPGWWAGPVVTLGSPSCSMQELRDRGRSAAGRPLRTRDSTPLAAGWHFSWLGGPAAIRAKAAAFSHVEQVAFIEANAERIYADRIHPSDPACRLQVTQIDGMWPRYMRQHLGPPSWYWPGEGT